MDLKIELCPICQLVLKSGCTVINKRNGLLIEIGYSMGGWGRRENHINFSGEVCIDCYSEFENKILEIKTLFIDRSGINAPDIQIKQRRTFDNVSSMQSDELSPRRRKASLLRFLPFISQN